MIAALYVLKNGPYSNIKGIDPWDIDRDARKYKGPHPVIAHPPCERWGRYWGGGPMLHKTRNQKLLGDDNGCFTHALWAVRTFDGILEHPEASHAWRWYGLNRPPQKGGWVKADDYGGFTCCVAQGNYGHRAQKLTWLYAKLKYYPELKWGKTPGLQRLDLGFHSKEERAQSKPKRTERLSKRQNEETPILFRNMLIALVSNPTKMNKEEG